METKNQLVKKRINMMLDYILENDFRSSNAEQLKIEDAIGATLVLRFKDEPNIMQCDITLE